MDITIEPWKKLIIHEIIEYQFDDWVKQIKLTTWMVKGQHKL